MEQFRAERKRGRRVGAESGKGKAVVRNGREDRRREVERRRGCIVVDKALVRYWMVGFGDWNEEARW